MEETNTTIYLADSNGGGFTTARQTQELQMHSADHKLEEKTTTLLPDGNGNWKVGEVKERTIQEDGKNRTIEERVSRPDLDGRLSEFSRTVGEETKTNAGEKSSTVDSYSKHVPGFAGDGSLHLNERVTTVQKKNSDGETTEQQVEQPRPGDPVTSTAHSMWCPRRGLNQTRFPRHGHRQHPQTRPNKIRARPQVAVLDGFRSLVVGSRRSAKQLT